MKKYIKSNNIKSRIIVCGGRHFDNYNSLDNLMDQVLSDLDLNFDEIEIISGHCSGADQLGELYANRNNVSCTIFPAQWGTYGKSAGPIRNSEMIKYAAESDVPVVVAFVSQNTKGTNDTINKAKRQNFHVYTMEYEVVESTISIYGGVRLSEDIGYDFDFNKDEDDDIVKLTKQHINKTRFNGKIRYFGYKVEQTVDKVIRNQFLSWIKFTEGCLHPGVEAMLDRCVEEFCENNDVPYDLIIPVASSSELTSILAKKVSDAFHSKILKTDKLEISNLRLDREKVITELHKAGASDNYIENLIKYIQSRYIDPQRQKGEFSIKAIKPQYRKWISPMFKFSDVPDFSSVKNILIVDETFTSGASVNQIVALLNISGFDGNIDIFTLLNNR